MNVVAAEAESCQKHDHHTSGSSFDKHSTVFRSNGCVLCTHFMFQFL